MLITLRIKNFAIVKQLELDFSTGMTAFTGETGAGKSIMIDALLLALGGRADPSFIRRGEDQCDISACFEVEKNSEPAQWIHQNDLNCEENLIILRRVLYQEGRSKSYVNGHLFPLQKVKELSEMLVHIHGQHDHQTLLQPNTHREQLDRYASHSKQLEELQHLYSKLRKIKQDIRSLSEKSVQKDRMELLKFQIQELSALKLQKNELKSLHEEHQLLHHAKDYLSYTHQIMSLLNSDDELTIERLIHQISTLLNQLPKDNKSIKSAMDLVSNAAIQCEEAYHEIKQFSEDIQIDPDRLEEVEARMGLIHQMTRKYQKDVYFLQDHLKNLEQELNTLNESENKLVILQNEYNVLEMQFEKMAIEIRHSRLLHAKKLAAEITNLIQKLGMPKGIIELELTPLEKKQPHGLDKVEYKVCLNPGTHPDSLSKIASGGELSRISLAIQMITAERGSTPTLLFDEVDVGIGGATAALVGQSLRKLGERLQVFCVTHQPQVAAFAHHHFMVEKNSDKQHTYSNIVALNQGEKVDEIARMLGGMTITDQTRSHAKELLTLSHESF